MRFANSYIPYGGYWSTPFARWQGSLAHLHAIRFAADTSSTIKASPTDFDSSSWEFAYQLGTGVAWALHEGADVTLDYRYFHAGGWSLPVLGSTGTLDGLHSHSLMLGLRIAIENDGRRSP